MNEYDEVLNEIDIFCSLDTIKKVKALINRATPMNPILKGYEFLCPKSESNVGYNDNQDYANYCDIFCWNCGQKLGDNNE